MGRNRQQGRRPGSNKRSQQEAAEIAELERVITAGAPAPGTNPLAVDSLPADSYAGAKKFEQLPLSNYTKEALKKASYTQLTAIQRAALPHALCGRDVLGAAKTGSGKTLAFLIPVRSGSVSATRAVAIAAGWHAGSAVLVPQLLGVKVRSSQLAAGTGSNGPCSYQTPYSLASVPQHQACIALARLCNWLAALSLQAARHATAVTAADRGCCSALHSIRSGWLPSGCPVYGPSD